ncbi:MAG: ComEC/Rec2 family competence protein [Bacteroidales bacterium]|nr:ComEC/Rec2 family competence protein [Bacteroidales bacterium]
MIEAGRIETLSLSFTAGVILGSMLPGGSPALAMCTLLALSLPCFLYPQLLRLEQRPGVTIITATFLILGMFCAINADMTDGLRLHSSVQVWADNAAGSLRALIRRIPFPGEATSPLLLALLTGDKSALPPETVAVFRQSGASHILALSGLHIGIIYLIFDRLTRIIGRSPVARTVRFVLIVAGAGFFTLMTGCGPSIVRAFLFITINETMRLLGRPVKPVRVLCLALLLQLVLEPSAIRSVGFQLSYLAMAGIFLLFPVLEKWYPESSKYDPFRKIWSMAALSISCQIFTGPLAWLRFHSFPRYFLLTNLMALPLTTTLMTSAVITVSLSAAGLCPAVLIKTTDGICRLLLWVLEIIASM